MILLLFKLNDGGDGEYLLWIRHNHLAQILKLLVLKYLLSAQLQPGSAWCEYPGVLDGPSDLAKYFHVPHHRCSSTDMCMCICIVFPSTALRRISYLVHTNSQQCELGTPLFYEAQQAASTGRLDFPAHVGRRRFHPGLASVYL